MPPSTAEGDRHQCLRLVALIGLEVDRDGGIAVSSRIASYNPEIRKLLSDRRLVPFLRGWPGVFKLSKEVQGDYRVSTLPDWKISVSGLEQAAELQPGDNAHQSEAPIACSCTCCGKGFRSRSALFKHLSAGVCPTAVTGENGAAPSDVDGSTVMQSADTAEGKALLQALIFALRRRLLRMERRDDQQQSNGNHPEVQQEARVSWLAHNKKAKVQRILISYVRSLPVSSTGLSDGSTTRTSGLESLSSQWWTEAEQLLTAFLRQKKQLFQVVLEATAKGNPIVAV